MGSDPLLSHLTTACIVESVVCKDRSRADLGCDICLRPAVNTSMWATVSDKCHNPGHLDSFCDSMGQ